MKSEIEYKQRVSLQLQMVLRHIIPPQHILLQKDQTYDEVEKGWTNAPYIKAIVPEIYDEEKCNALTEGTTNLPFGKLKFDISKVQYFASPTKIYETVPRYIYKRTGDNTSITAPNRYTYYKAGGKYINNPDDLQTLLTKQANKYRINNETTQNIQQIYYGTVKVIFHAKKFGFGNLESTGRHF